MKKAILTLISILPFTSVSMAASIKLNDLTREEKILLIEDAMERSPDVNLNEVENESDLDKAIEKLLKDGIILDGAKVKKGSGGESVGGIGGN